MHIHICIHVYIKGMCGGKGKIHVENEGEVTTTKENKRLWPGKIILVWVCLYIHGYIHTSNGPLIGSDIHTVDSIDCVHAYV